MEQISVKKQWIQSSGWHGYEEPIFGVCGANNTGNWNDSICPENVCLIELKKAAKILKDNGIKYKRTVCKTSNVFCISVWLVTSLADQYHAIKLLTNSNLVENTRLLYLKKVN